MKSFLCQLLDLTSSTPENFTIQKHVKQYNDMNKKGTKNIPIVVKIKIVYSPKAGEKEEQKKFNIPTQSGVSDRPSNVTIDKTNMTSNVV